jgi:hypothetical protein
MSSNDPKHPTIRHPELVSGSILPPDLRLQANVDLAICAFNQGQDALHDGP